MPTANQMRCMSLSPTQWPHNREFVLLRLALSLTASLSYLAPAFQNVENRLGKHDVAVSTKLSGLVIIPASASVFRFTAFEDIPHRSRSLVRHQAGI
jgi:hypothetical protein